MKHCCYPEIAKTTFDQNPYTESHNNLHCVVKAHVLRSHLARHFHMKENGTHAIFSVTNRLREPSIL